MTTPPLLTEVRKTDDTYKAFMLPISDEQMDALEPYLQSIQAGESIIAQIYWDGIRVKKLTAEQALAIARLLQPGTPLDQMECTNSAQEAQDRAERKVLQ